MIDFFDITKTCATLAYQLATLGNKPDDHGTIAKIELSRKTYFNVATEANKAATYPNPFGAADTIRMATPCGYVELVPSEIAVRSERETLQKVPQ